MGARAAYHVHAVAADEGGEAAPPTFQRLFSIQHTDFHSDARLFAEPQSAHRVNAILQTTVCVCCCEIFNPPWRYPPLAFFLIRGGTPGPAAHADRIQPRGAAGDLPGPLSGFVSMAIAPPTKN